MQPGTDPMTRVGDRVSLPVVQGSQQMGWEMVRAHSTTGSCVAEAEKLSGRPVECGAMAN